MAQKKPVQPKPITALSVLNGLLEDMPELATATPEQIRQYARLIRAATAEIKRTAPKIN